MRQVTAQLFARRLYREHHGAEICPTYLSWRSVAGSDGRPLAVLGFRGAADGPLFLERYFDRPVEAVVSQAAGANIERARIVEIGCLAALPSGALLRLWRSTASTLSGSFDIAVATLTAPLRAQFKRIGLPITELAAATAESSRSSRDAWGRYYAADPVVCMGQIARGADALTRFSPLAETRA